MVDDLMPSPSANSPSTVLEAPAVHGPNGRIALTRRMLGMTQLEFAKAVGVARETVSHWENFDTTGRPRQVATPQHAAAIARVLADSIQSPVGVDLFLTLDETPIERSLRELVHLRESHDQVVRDQRRLARELARVVDLVTDVHRLLAVPKTD